MFIFPNFKGWQVFRFLKIFILLAAADIFAASLQSKDIFFISSFKSPDYIAGNHRKVYIGKGKNILVFDKGQNKWEKTLQIDGQLKGLFFSSIHGRIRAETDFEDYWEFNEGFEDWTSVDRLKPLTGDSGRVEEPQHKNAGRLPGLVLPANWHQSFNQIRDPNHRWAFITKKVVFDYDDLWVLTNGLGVFRGSERKGNLKPVWMGLGEPETRSLFRHGNHVFMGSDNTRGALVKTTTNLQDWRHYEVRYRGLSTGKVFDITHWENYYWFATPDGVIRLDESMGTFFVFDYFKGLRSDHAYVLAHHQGSLFAGTERGIAELEPGKSEFKFIPHSHLLNARINGMSSEGPNLWVSTNFGIYRYVDGNWDQPKYIDRTKGINIPDVEAINGDIYWIQSDEVYVLKKNETPRSIITRKGARKLKKQGPYLMVLYDNGVDVYNLKNHLSVDFSLIDGIIGGKVFDAILFRENLWVATDEGVSKINASYYLP